MKTLVDKINVNSRIFYYLLDFNDSDNWEYISNQFGTQKLSDLTISQFAELFRYATIKDRKYLMGKTNKNQSNG